MRWTVRAILVFSFLMSSAGAQEWTRFRGPNGTGFSPCKTIPVEWSEEDISWKAEIPGVGHSSPVIWGDKIFLLSADPENATRYMLCYSATDGRQLWSREYPSKTHRLHIRSSYASSTPAVDAEHVYVGWSTPEETLLKAFHHDGREAWSKDLGRWVSQHGFGASPILFEDLVILHNSQQANQLDPGEKPGESYMMAFRRETGEELWRTPLVSKNVCYSVPFIFEPDGGEPELVCTSTGNGLFSLDPRTGAKNWAVADAFSMRTVASPILSGGHIFGSTGSGRYSGNYVVAVKPGTDAKVAYKLSNSRTFKAPYVPCAIAKGDKVFLLYDRAFAACIDARSGEVHWSERMPDGAAFSGSPILIRDKIYAIDEDGVVWVIAADENTFRVLARNPLGEPSRSTPAVSGGRLFLRTYSHLFCLGAAETSTGG